MLNFINMMLLIKNVYSLLNKTKNFMRLYIIFLMGKSQENRAFYFICKMVRFKVQ